MADEMTQASPGAAARATDASGTTGAGRQRRAPRAPRAAIESATPPAPSPLVEWRSLELVDRQLTEAWAQADVARGMR